MPGNPPVPFLLTPPPGWIDPHDWTLSPDTNWLNAADFLTDRTGTIPQDQQLANAFNALQTPSGAPASGWIYIPPGSQILLNGNGPASPNGWNVSPNQSNQVVVFCGAGVQFIYTGSGACINMHSTGTVGKSGGSGIIGNPLIDGTGAAAGAIGLDFGDIFQGKVFVHPQNFSGVGSMGVHFNNALSFTEQLEARVWSKGNSNAVVFDVTGATTSTQSFARPDFVLMCESTSTSSDRNGVVIQNGASPYDMVRFGIYGNFPSNAAGSAGSVLTVTGSIPAGHPNPGAPSKLQFGAFNVGVETTSNVVTPVTITYGASTNIIRDTFGILDFNTFGTPGVQQFASSNLLAVGAQFRHWGPVIGDTVLGTTEYFGTRPLGAIITGGTIAPLPGGDVSVNPAGAVTGIIVGVGTLDGQELIVKNLSAFSVTFAAAGTSNVAAGVSATVPALTSRVFIWDAAQSLWYGGV